MKQFVILFLLFTISQSVSLLHKTKFCEIIEQIVSQKKNFEYTSITGKNAIKRKISDSKTKMKKLKSSIPGWKHLTLCPHWVGNSSKHM